MDKPYVLIIDDEQLLLSSYSYLLESDFNVITASNGKEGLLQFRSNPSLSLILLDLKMPVMDGVETLEAIRAIDHEIKILIMTGQINQEWTEQCADLNVQGYIKKPIDPEYLLERVKKVLGMIDYPVLKERWKVDYETKVLGLSPMIKEAISFIHTHVDKDITRENVANHLGITSDHLCKKLNKECGLTINNYINRYKIHISQEYLLSMPDKTIAQIAERTGITDTNYFSRLFKKYSGLTPGQFRRNTTTN